MVGGGCTGREAHATQSYPYIIHSFPRKGQSEGEAAYFIEAAALLQEELPEALRPAADTEEVAFAMESVFAPPSAPPFGVHQFWMTKAGMGMEEVAGLLQSCPEALAIVPPHVVRDSAGWREVVCGGKWGGEGGVPRVSEAWTEEDVCLGGGVGGGGGGEGKGTINENESEMK